MNAETEISKRGAFATLQQFIRKPEGKPGVCELCAAPMGAKHQHLLDIGKRHVICSCDSCAVLLGGNTRQRYRRIPRDIVRLHDFRIDDEQWTGLSVPIDLAFFVRSSTCDLVTAHYPSPAGLMESSLALECWKVVVQRNPGLNQFAPDVEALLVNRIAGNRQYYRAPIDQCFRLVGIVRRHWYGISGGTEVWKEIRQFFEELNEG
jgi:Family of unknown function (DUF5947)